jgi:hypothetical protein
MVRLAAVMLCQSSWKEPAPGIDRDQIKLDFTCFTAGLKLMAEITRCVVPAGAPWIEAVTRCLLMR